LSDLSGPSLPIQVPQSVSAFQGFRSPPVPLNNDSQQFILESASFPPSSPPRSFSPATNQDQTLDPFIPPTIFISSLHPPKTRESKKTDSPSHRHPSLHHHVSPPPHPRPLPYKYARVSLPSRYSTLELEPDPAYHHQQHCLSYFDRQGIRQRKDGLERPPHHPRHPHKFLYRAALLQGPLAAAVGGGQGRVEGEDAGGG